MNLIKLNNDTDKLAALAADFIKSGGLVIVPFDTVYGIICSPFDDKALNKIFAIKERAINKTIGTATNNTDSLSQFAILNSGQAQFIASHTPGPYTFILNSKPSNISSYCLQNGTLGIRIPNSDLILKIAELAGGIIAQTSVNKSGHPNCYSVIDIKNQLSPLDFDGIDLMIDGGELNRNSASSEIWNLTTDTPVKIER